MVSKDLIERIQKMWASPIVFVPKNNVTLQFCIDNCKLNVVKIWDFCTIPRMEECISPLGDTTICSTLVANRSYWHVEIVKEDVDKDAIKAHHRLSRFIRMPFRLKMRLRRFKQQWTPYWRK